MMAATMDDMQAMSMSPDTKVPQIRKQEIARKFILWKYLYDKSENKTDE